MENKPNTITRIVDVYGRRYWVNTAHLNDPSEHPRTQIQLMRVDGRRRSDNVKLRPGEALSIHRDNIARVLYEKVA